jgi:hypothetical protein
MPHVVIEEALDLAGACQSIQLTAVRNRSEILKVVDVYLTGRVLAIPRNRSYSLKSQRPRWEPSRA